MGRRSNEDQKGYEPKPYDVFFTPRMGKRSEVVSSNVSPFGRSMFTGKPHILQQNYSHVRYRKPKSQNNRKFFCEFPLPFQINKLMIKSGHSKKII